MPVCGGSTGFAARKLSLAVSFVACSDFCAHPVSASAITSTPPILLGRNIPIPPSSGLGICPMARNRVGYRPVLGLAKALITGEPGLANPGGVRRLSLLPRSARRGLLRTLDRGRGLAHDAQAAAVLLELQHVAARTDPCVECGIRI